MTSEVVHQTKKIKLCSCSTKLLEFPHELWVLIFSHLDPKDLTNLSLLNSKFNAVLKPYIFNHLKLDWMQVLDRLDETNRISQFVETIEIVEPSLHNEWNYKFVNLLSQTRFSNLNTFIITISNSSNFLKYNEPLANITNLKIITVNNNESNFNLNHLKNFVNLQVLTIDGFLIDFEKEDLKDIQFQLKTLNLINCKWNYPFKLSTFGFNSIENLNLVYSNSFILSERFREFLNNPNLPNLTNLTIQNNNYNNKLHITFKILIFLKNIPNLKKLYLIGNIYNESINHFTFSDIENIRSAKYLMNVNNVKIFYSKFVS